MHAFCMILCILVLHRYESMHICPFHFHMCMLLSICMRTKINVKICFHACIHIYMWNCSFFISMFLFISMSIYLSLPIRGCIIFNLYRCLCINMDFELYLYLYIYIYICIYIYMYIISTDSVMC